MDVHQVRKVINAFEVIKNFAPNAAKAAGKDVYGSLASFFCAEVVDVNTQMKKEFPLVTANNQISAIRRYRELTGTSLFDAQNWVETHLPQDNRLD